jgi:hypothetical protein
MHYPNIKPQSKPHILKLIFAFTSSLTCSVTKNFFQKAQKQQFPTQFNAFNKIQFCLQSTNLIFLITSEEIRRFIKFWCKSGIS